nr:MAG TPA: hypothetical protein [Caudoviricetes sp.]
MQTIARGHAVAFAGECKICVPFFRDAYAFFYILLGKYGGAARNRADKRHRNNFRERLKARRDGGAFSFFTDSHKRINGNA